MVYLGAQVKPVKILAIEAEGRGAAYGKDSYYDIIGRVKVKPYGPVFLAAGYRYEKIKFDESGFKANADFQGPFGEAGVEF